MLRAIINRRLICSAFFPFNFSSDSDSNGKLTELFKRKAFINKYGGYFFDEKGYPTKELQSVYNATSLGFITGFLLGGINKVKDIREIHKKENQATLYEHKFYAYRDVQNKISSALTKGGISFGIKVGFFCFLFSSVSAFLFVYREKFDVLNTMFSGAVAGFIYKMNMGLKGAFAGTLLGTILGAIYGCITSFILFITQTDMNNLYEAGSKLMNARRDKIKENAKNVIQKEELKLKELHEYSQKTNHILGKEQQKE
ncbi:upstream protein [Apis mellifera caucasica]|uniref:Complex I assembly factor TIMMDC1, mitochondrial n=1 Tax=Apis mellifera TaxID=7460 RepID=A0A7M7G9X1_APIME|nr:RPII140-upstream gene protein [Apis mellifera]KAG6803164.1 upstream protein [Apis mellifera caucasica]KAG9431670.1 upstream protein [Apis mellifera carnica]|eukprot:XP_003249403.1 RPII140-upstream gene protein [Apis mellifera]